MVGSGAGAQSVQRLVIAAILAGLAGGLLDIVGAIIVYGPILQTPITPERILQSVASGLLGRDAFNGGLGTASLGLAAHLVISFVAAGIYVLASTRLLILVSRPVLSGIAFGVAVYFFMTQVVVPLSAAPTRPLPALEQFLIALGLNVFLFGLPIAIIARLCLGEARR